MYSSPLSLCKATSFAPTIRVALALAAQTAGAYPQFYENLGFKTFGGEAVKKGLILKDGDHVIGLFQGIFDKNILQLQSWLG